MSEFPQTLFVTVRIRFEEKSKVELLAVIAAAKAFHGELLEVGDPCPPRAGHRNPTWRAYGAIIYPRAG